MARVQQVVALRVSEQACRAMYPDRGERVRRIPLPPEILDVLPPVARRAIQAALAKGGMRAYLLPEEAGVCVVLVNRRPR